MEVRTPSEPVWTTAGTYDSVATPTIAVVVTGAVGVQACLDNLCINGLDAGVVDACEPGCEALLLRGEQPVTMLLHPEVRYEVTDHCNATCIMCPRDKHEHGREHGGLEHEREREVAREAHADRAHALAAVVLQRPGISLARALRIGVAAVVLLPGARVDGNE